MRATRSNDTVLDGAFVPDERIACAVPAGAGSITGMAWPAKIFAAKQHVQPMFAKIQRKNRQRHIHMNAIELIGDIDEQHRLYAQVPKELPVGQVRLIVLLPGEDDAGSMWAHGVAAEWSEELQDPREDIYTLDDGQPVNAPR